MPTVALQHLSCLFIRQPLLLARPAYNLVTRRTMKAFIQVVGQTSAEGPPTIIVHYDSQRYMFNCREGTQRLCIEEKVKLSRLQNIYLTRLDWSCVGGLPGMILTLADAHGKDLRIHGGKNLTHLIAATRHFAYRESMKLETREYMPDSPATKDEGPLQVTPVVVLPKDFNTPVAGVKRSRSNLEEEEGEGEGGAAGNAEADDAYRRRVIQAMFTGTKPNGVPEQTMKAKCTPRDTKVSMHPLDDATGSATVQQTTPRQMRSFQYIRQPLPRTTPYPAAISYICRGPTVRGKFKPDVAKALGIKPGPLYGKLQKGNSVTLEDGRVIEPSQVMDPDKPGHVFAIVDCADESYIDNLVESEKWTAYQNADNHPLVIFHLTTSNVLRNCRYQEWMSKFGPETQHVLATEDLCAQTVLFKKHALGQLKLSKLDKGIFPIPKYSNTAAVQVEKLSNLPPKVYPLKNMMQCDLEPRKGVNVATLKHPAFDHNNLEDLDIKEFVNNKEFAEVIEKAKAQASTVDINQPFPGDNVRVITLGTGSSIPAKYRNVSATLVHIPGNTSIMLDAGEGTLGQMMRVFGPERMDLELKRISCIFVSHLHADHHLGVVQLLTRWYHMNKHSKNKLYVVAPAIFRHWLDEYNDVQRFGLYERIQFIRNESILSGKSPEEYNERKNFSQVKDMLGVKDLRAVEVFHCKYAYGISMVHNDGWKLVYSGDTRPCDNLIEQGKDATLLIHEATLEDSMHELALAKRHTTTGEAVQVGKDMNAKYTLLTHFSQRYPKIPALSADQTNVCYSFDMMTVKMKQLPLLPKFTEAIQLIFKDAEEEEKDVEEITLQ